MSIYGVWANYFRSLSTFSSRRPTLPSYHRLRLSSYSLLRLTIRYPFTSCRDFEGLISTVLWLHFICPWVFYSLPPLPLFLSVSFFLSWGSYLDISIFFFYFLFYFLPSLNDKVFGFSLRLFGDCTIDIRFRFSSLVIRSMTPGS